MMPPKDKVNEEVTDLDEIDETVTDESEDAVDEELEKAKARGDFIEDEDEEEVDEEKEEVDGETSDDDEESEEDSEDDEESGDTDGNSTESPSEEPKIPKSRLDKVISQREDYKAYAEKIDARAEARESQLLDIIKTLQDNTDSSASSEPEFDFDAKEEAAMEAILEGDAKAYKAIRKEINDHILEAAKVGSEGLSETAVKAAKEETHKLNDEARFAKAVDVFSKKYTFLDASSDDFNDDAIDEIDKYYNKFVKAGDNKADALTEAVNLIVPRYLKKEERSGLGEIDKAKADRKAKAVKKAAKVTKQQPPETKSKKEKPIEEFSYENLRDMNDKDWKDLPAAVKKKLRGD